MAKAGASSSGSGPESTYKGRNQRAARLDREKKCRLNEAASNCSCHALPGPAAQASAGRLAAQSGAAGVQLDCRNELKSDELSATGRRELLHRVEEMRLSIASLDFPLKRGLLDPDRLDARLGGPQAGDGFWLVASLSRADGTPGRVACQERGPTRSSRWRCSTIWPGTAIMLA